MVQYRSSEQGDSDAGEVSPAHAPDDMRGALAKMVDEQFLKHPTYEHQQWRANRNGAHLLIIEFEKALVRHMRLLGVPVYAHCVVRTREEQKRLFAEGRSRISGLDEYPHQHCACDIIHSKYGWNLSPEQWKMLGHIGLELANKRGIAITWGGSPEYRFYDPAHWELTQWRERAKEVLRG